MKFPVALQLFSVRDEASKDLRGTLAQVKQMGYDGVEFAGLHGHDAADIRQMLDEVGLVGISAHVAPAELMSDIQGKINDYATIGCKYIAVPYLGEQDRPGATNWPQIANAIRRIAVVAKEKGITILYHNHDFEFTKQDGEYLLDLMYKELPAEVLQTELDTCWVNVGGESPVEYILKYSGRAPVVHIKDFVGSKTENMYELIGIDKKADVTQKFEFRPVGKGVQNFPAIIDAAVQAGTSWFVVEQDMPSLGLTAMECARESIEYMKTIL